MPSESLVRSGHWRCSPVRRCFGPSECVAALTRS